MGFTINQEKEKQDTVKFKENILNMIQIHEKRIEEIKDDINQIEKQEPENDKHKQWLMLQNKNLQISRKQNVIHELENKYRFSRPDTQQDTNYRLQVMKTFASKMENTIPKDLPLRFHGTSLWNAENIIQTKSISSSVDRLGYATSYDGEEEISVTDARTLMTTISSYTHLGDRHEPAGCVFVLFPKDEGDANLSMSLLMQNVDFEKSPEQLYGIITTPENVNLVYNWCVNANLDTKVMDFIEFEVEMEKENQMNEIFGLSENNITDIQSNLKQTNTAEDSLAQSADEEDFCLE